MFGGQQSYLCNAVSNTGSHDAQTMWNQEDVPQTQITWFELEFQIRTA